MNKPRQVVRRDEAGRPVPRENEATESLRHRFVQLIRRIPSITWAAVASVLALLSVVVPGFFYDHAPYDPTLAILTITAIAIICYTAFSYELVNAMWKDREERQADREEQKDEQRRRLEIVLIQANRVLGNLVNSADDQEILSRLGWFERIEQILDSFVGLDDGEYDIELMLAAEALLELRIQTDSTLRSQRVPDMAVGGEPDKLTRLLDEAEMALVTLYARITNQTPEQVRPGIPK